MPRAVSGSLRACADEGRAHTLTHTHADTLAHSLTQSTHIHTHTCPHTSLTHACDGVLSGMLAFAGSFTAIFRVYIFPTKLLL